MGILHHLLDLTFFPARSGIAEIGFKQIVIDYRLKSAVNGALLTAANFIDGRFHVDVNSALRYAAKHTEGVVVCIEQHLMSLGKVGAQKECKTTTELEICHLQLDLGAGNYGPAVTAIKLKCLAGCKAQRDIGVLACFLLGNVLCLLLFARKGRNAIIGAVIAEQQQVGIELFGVFTLLAMPPRLTVQPAGKRSAVSIELTWRLTNRVFSIKFFGVEILTNGIAREPGSSSYISNRLSFSEMPTANHTN